MPPLATAAAVRRLPVPPSRPPFDDEAAPRPARHTAQAALALAFQLPGDLPAVPEPPAQLRLVDPAGVPAVPDWDPGWPMRDPAEEEELAWFAARRQTPSAELPDPLRWSARLAQGMVEVMCGHRPLRQLLRWTDEAVYAALASWVQGLREASASRPVVRALRVCQPADGVVEASAVVQTGQRCRALALRLEGLDGRWRCTSAELV